MGGDNLFKFIYFAAIAWLVGGVWRGRWFKQAFELGALECLISVLLRGHSGQIGVKIGVFRCGECFPMRYRHFQVIPGALITLIASHLH